MKTSTKVIALVIAAAAAAAGTCVFLANQNSKENESDGTNNVVETPPDPKITKFDAKYLLQYL